MGKSVNIWRSYGQYCSALFFDSQCILRHSTQCCIVRISVLCTLFSVICYALQAPLYSLFIMAALRSRCGHYIFALWFLSIFYLLSSFFIPRLISAAADWMSTILPHMVWPYSANLECRSERCCTRLAGNTGRKMMQKIAICAPSNKFVGLYLRN